MQENFKVAMAIEMEMEKRDHAPCECDFARPRFVQLRSIVFDKGLGFKDNFQEAFVKRGKNLIS